MFGCEWGLLWVLVLNVKELFVFVNLGEIGFLWLERLLYIFLCCVECFCFYFDMIVIGELLNLFIGIEGFCLFDCGVVLELFFLKVMVCFECCGGIGVFVELFIGVFCSEEFLCFCFGDEVFVLL